MTTYSSFDDFVSKIDRLGGSVSIETGTRDLIDAVVNELSLAVGGVSQQQLVKLVGDHPEYVPILGLCVRVSQEQLKNLLRHWFSSSSWNRIAKSNAKDLVARLDSDFNLVGEINSQLANNWTFADILAERYAPRLRAAGSIQRGRELEDAVESIVNEIGLPHVMRTRFSGRAGQTAPCDLAIPKGETDAQIVCGIKGFDSTGSKLTDAAREIQQMADTRLPSQYVFAVVDGLGWLSRRADLKRIYDLSSNRAIDGIYTRANLAQLRVDLLDAARRMNIAKNSSQS